MRERGKRHNDYAAKQRKLEWLRKHEWGSDTYKPGSAEEKRLERAKIRYEMARAYALTKGEKDWPRFDDLPSPEKDAMVDFFVPPAPPAVVRVFEGGAALADDTLIIPTASGVQIENPGDYIEIQGRIYISRQATIHALQEGFVVAVQPELTHLKPRHKAAVTKDPSWWGIQLIHLGHYKIRPLNESEQRQRRRAMRAAAGFYHAFKDWSSQAD